MSYFSLNRDLELTFELISVRKNLSELDSPLT